MKTELCNLMDKFGSDKASNHNYTIFYYEILKEKRNDEMNIFELGLGTNNIDIPSNMGENGKPGASLRAWREFFPNSKIYGADVDKKILFKEDRIETFYCDQTKKESIDELWDSESLKNIKFDIIIDDGLHEVKANIKFLKNSFSKLKKGGIYIIEDLMNFNIKEYELRLKELAKKLKFNFEIKNFHHTNQLDNVICYIKNDN